MKKVKAPKVAHTSDTKYGMGDFYGTGFRQPFGKMREGPGQVEVPKKKLSKPPKSFA